MPFKQKIINQTDKIINDAELTGSVNTILLDNNKIIGEYRCIRFTSSLFKRNRRFAFKNTLVIGAGVYPSVILSLQKSE